jgi:hypothetical protein
MCINNTGKQTMLASKPRWTAQGVARVAQLKAARQLIVNIIIQSLTGDAVAQSALLLVINRESAIL